MRKSVLIACVLLMSSTLTGCGLGTQLPDTATMRGVGNGVDVKSGDLLAQDVTVVTTGTSVGLSVTVINKAETETAVSGASINGKALVLALNGEATTALPVLPSGATRIGFQSVESVFGPYVVAAGEYADVVLRFVDGSVLTARALVVNKSGMYADVVTDLPAPAVA